MSELAIILCALIVGAVGGIVLFVWWLNRNPPSGMLPW